MELVFIILVYSILIPMSFCQLENSTSADGEPNCDGRCSKKGEYIGCYGIGCLQQDHNVTFQDRTNSPDACSIACEERGFAFAAIFSGLECSCTCPHGEQDCLGKALVDSRCGVPCITDRDSFCGGYMTMSLYRVNSSISNLVCRTKIDESDGPYDPDNPFIMTSTETPGSLAPIAVYISVPIAVLLIITVVVILVYRRCRHPEEGEREETVTVVKIAKQDSESINEEQRYRLSIRDKGIQDSDSHVAKVTGYQPLNMRPKLPDIPEDDVTAKGPSLAGLRERIYEDPDLEISSAPTAGSDLNHEYLVSGQGVPSSCSPSDEYHEYNYPDVGKARLKAPVRANRTADDGYLVVEPDLQSLQKPGSKVYYSSCVRKAETEGQGESPETPRKGTYYSSRIRGAVNEEENGSSDGTTAYSTHVSRRGEKLGAESSTGPADPKAYYATRVRRSDNQGLNIS